MSLGNWDITDIANGNASVDLLFTNTEEFVDFHIDIGPSMLVNTTGGIADDYGMAIALSPDSLEGIMTNGSSISTMDTDRALIRLSLSGAASEEEICITNPTFIGLTGQVLGVDNELCYTVPSATLQFGNLDTQANTFDLILVNSEMYIGYEIHFLGAEIDTIEVNMEVLSFLTYTSPTSILAFTMNPMVGIAPHSEEMILATVSYLPDADQICFGTVIFPNQFNTASTIEEGPCLSL